jgi:hypothetical protein
MRTPSRLAPPDPLVPALLDKLTSAQQAHIADLRVLVDQAHEREKDLAGMVRMVMEERFFRPTVTRPANESPKPSTAELETLNDVATFDGSADAKTIQEQDIVAKEIAAGIAAIAMEEREYRASRGTKAE